MRAAVSGSRYNCLAVSSLRATHMATFHEHNLRQPLPAERPFGIRVRLRGSDPLRNRFEIEAGLEDGGYVRRRRPQPRPARHD